MKQRTCRELCERIEASDPQLAAWLTPSGKSVVIHNRANGRTTVLHNAWEWNDERHEFMVGANHG